MENLSHSRQPNAVSKKSCNGSSNNGNFGAAKSIYDDVFGGPSRFGAPTLSPRVEDYAEIFGGFHASRATSIPVLDLPLVDEDEVFFDEWSPGFDYAEVFGGFSSPDFAVSCEELMMLEQSNGHDDSSDEAWTPEEAEYLSDELDHSSKKQLSSNGDAHGSIDGCMEFNISYHKASQRSNGDISNGVTHLTQLCAVPGYTAVVDKTTSLPKIDDDYSSLQVSDDGHLDIDFSGETMRGRHLRKTLSHPANGHIDVQFNGNDVRPHKRYVRNGSLPIETFMTISDVSLKTEPSQLPPPSRPPPALAIKKVDSSNWTPNCGSVAAEGTAGDSSPPYFDVEVDASSSAAASAAAMKEAMEKAQAKLKSAKELMERKREGFQNLTKSGSKNVRKAREGKVTKIVNSSDHTKDERMQGTCEVLEENGKIFSALEERQKVMRTTELVPDSSEGERHLNLAKKPADEKHERESWSSQGSDKIDGGGEWKEATQFFELVRTNQPRTDFDQANSENTLQSTNIHVSWKKEGKATMEVSEQHKENKKKVEAVRANMEQCEKKAAVSMDACEWKVNNGRLEAAKAIHRQKELVKDVQMAQEASKLEENAKKMRMNGQPVERAVDLQKLENMVEVQWSKCKIEVKQLQSVEHKEKEPQPKKNSKNMEDGKRLMHGREREKENPLKATLEQADSERRLMEALDQEEKEKRKAVHEQEEHEKEQKDSFEREENEKRLRETRGREENERRLKESLEKEENDRRLKRAVEREENDRRQKESIDQAENEKRQREARGRRGNEKRVKETAEREEKEKRLKEAFEWEENEKRQRDAWEREENEKRVKVSLEQQENELKQKVAREREETEKRCREAIEKEEIEKTIEEACVREEIAIRLEEVFDEENGKTLREAREREQSEKLLKEVSELDEIEAMFEVTYIWDETNTKLNNAGESDELTGLNKMEEDCGSLSQACKLDDSKNLGATRLDGKYEGTYESLQATVEIADGKVGKTPTEPGNNEKNASVKKLNVLIDGKTEVSGTAQGNTQHEENRFPTEDAAQLPGADESPKKAGETGYETGQRNIEKIKHTYKIYSDIGNQGEKFAHEMGEGVKNIKHAQVVLNQEASRDNCTSARIVKESVESGEKLEVVQPATSDLKGIPRRTAQLLNASQSSDRQVKNLNETLPSEAKEAERMRIEKELEKERLRKMEEEREREREREKDRMAVDRVTLEARERAFAEARERAERAAVERAMNEARERLEKACAEARGKSLADKTLTEARLRAERSAVEKAAAEARDRAFEKAMAERAAFEAKERVERSVSDKFSASSRNIVMKPSSSSSDLQDLQSQSSSSFIGSRYSSVYSGVEGESAQRCKARLERHRRTAERAAKALAEKNMRDLLAQREQAERNRLAETLDADVKRWSSGKEGNLRALLSTLQYILGPESGWQPIPLTEVITSAAVKKAYRKATLCVHPDKLQQRGASIQQKYICEKVFDLLKEGWNRFNSEER